jgi:2-keto-4-pentenoate hydratase
VRALRIGVEITDTRLPPASPFLAELSDSFNNGAYVVGPACSEWQHIDFGRHVIVLRADGRELARGDGRPILDGDPLAAVVMLANAQPPRYGGLRAGHVVTTGTCTGAVAPPGPCRLDADFGALGHVALSFE